MQVRIGQDLLHIPQRCGGHMVPLAQCADFLARAGRRPIRHRCRHRVDPRDAPFEVTQRLVRAEIGTVHRFGKVRPVLIGGADDRDPAVRDRERVRDVGVGDVPVSGPPRHGAAGVGMSGGRKHRREGRLEHRHLDGTATAGALAFIGRRCDRPVEMGAGHEVGDRDAALSGRPPRSGGGSPCGRFRVRGQAAA